GAFLRRLLRRLLRLAHDLLAAAGLRLGHRRNSSLARSMLDPRSGRMSMFSESLRAFLKPVVAFLDDPDVSEILINGHREVWVERHGKLHRTDATFTEEGLLAAARNMAQYVGRPLTDERPRLDARMPDGSRIHVVLPPVARRGTTISIRKFLGERLTPRRLLESGTCSPMMARFLQAAVGL